MITIEQLKGKVQGLEEVKKFPATGQKQVYLVKTDQYGQVILKIVQNMDERIIREIDIVTQNNITNVPKIVFSDTIEVNGESYFYLLEEYVNGQNLKEVLQNGAMKLSDSLNLLEYLLKVTVELEDLKVVHRDIKPENIIWSKDGNFHLIDFGIARNLNLSSLTLTHMAVGPHTPGYGAPELFQYNKANINSKADLFSIGVVVYQAIFGKHPFLTGREIDLNEVWYRTVTTTPTELLIEGDNDKQLIGFIQTLMQKHVSKRPPSAKKALEWFNIVINTLLL